TEPVPLIEKLLASLAKVYRHKKLQTRFKFDDDVFFAGEQGDLMELMGNLLDNAFKFAISEIQVTVSRRLDRLRIEIEDDGPGIDPGKSQQIFQRGVRADSSPGQGIGLAVVTEIVHSYGGQIMVDESPLGGARFTLDLPWGHLCPPSAPANRQAPCIVAPPQPLTDPAVASTTRRQ